MRLGEKIKKYRKGANLTQDDLAQKIGISKSFMSKIEIDDKTPSIEVVLKIANELKIPYLDLIKDTDYEKFKGIELNNLSPVTSDDVKMIETVFGVTDTIDDDLKEPLTLTDALDILLKRNGHSIKMFTSNECDDIIESFENTLDIMARIKNK